MGIFDWVKHKQEDKRKTKEAEDELRRQAEAEVSEEVIKIKKDKIKQQILSEARGEKKPEGKGSQLLKQLGDEFKNSNIGNSEQMDKLLGKRNNSVTSGKQEDNFSTDRLMGVIGGKKKSANTNHDYAGALGGSGPTSDKLRMLTGVKVNTKGIKKMSRLRKE